MLTCIRHHRQVRIVSQSIWTIAQELPLFLIDADSGRKVFPTKLISSGNRGEHDLGNTGTSEPRAERTAELGSKEALIF
jgi:hypothetical protein